MGLSSLRRHRGDYQDRALVQRDPTKEELAQMLQAEKAKTTALEAELAELKKPPPPSLDPVYDKQSDPEPIPEPATALAPEPSPDPPQAVRGKYRGR